MPELPEVETTVQELRKKIIGKKILNVFVETPKLIKNLSLENFKKEVKNKEIKDVWRKGKNIIFELSDNNILLVHQKLTGHLLLGRWEKIKNEWVAKENSFLKEPVNRFIRVVFLLSNNEMLALSDLRKFAKIEFWKKEDFLNSKEFKQIGPDALDVDFEDFKKRLLARKNKSIKEALMDQTIIAGIGNIYSDEILWRAKIYPLKKISSLSENDFKTIFLTMKNLLKKAILLKGESISDYRRPNGEKGNFDQERMVYRRAGEKCSRCSFLIKRIKIGARSSYFCPHCQKK